MMMMANLAHMAHTDIITTKTLPLSHSGTAITIELLLQDDITDIERQELYTEMFGITSRNLGYLDCFHATAPEVAMLVYLVEPETDQFYNTLKTCSVIWITNTQRVAISILPRFLSRIIVQRKAPLPDK